MPRLLPPLVLLPALLSWNPAHGQDAARGARLYLGLPGGQAACVECHGPDPSLDRNRLLNAARGPAFITEAIRKAAAMGYLSDLLDDRDKADLSAFLAQVSADADGSALATVWPFGLEFGRVQPGQAPAPHTVRLRNRGSTELALSPRLRQLGPAREPGLTLTHDCPLSLAPGAACALDVGLVAGAEGRVQAVLEWGDAATGSARPVGVAATITTAATGEARWTDAGAGGPLMLEARPGSSTAVVLALHNTGTAPLTLGVPAITGPGRTAFRLEAGGCGANLSLPVDGRCTVRLVATAPTAGREEALLQWRNDGGAAPLRRLEVRASAGAPAPAPPPSDAPAPSPSPSPSPAPSPAPAPPLAGPEAGAAGGGCSIAWAPTRTDPLLPLITGLSAAALWWRRRRQRRGAAPGALQPAARPAQ